MLLIHTWQFFFNYEIKATNLKLWPLCFKASRIFPVTWFRIKYTTYLCLSCLAYEFLFQEFDIKLQYLIQNNDYVQQLCHIQFKYNQ